MSKPTAYLTLSIEALGDEPLSVDAAYGHEAISEMYEYRVFVRLPAHQSVEVIGEKATFTAWPADSESRGWWRFELHGIIAQARLVTAMGSEGGEPMCLHELTIVPRVFPLSLSRLSRVFVDKDVVNIAKLICEDTGDQAVVINEQGTYEAREHVCQYRESRWTFLNRILEREGLFYRFDHSFDQSDSMAVTDDHQAWAEIRSDSEAVHFDAGGAETSMLGSDCVWAVSRSQHALPNTMILGDNDYLHPAANQREKQFGIDVIEATEVHYGEDGRRGTKPLKQDLKLRLERNQIARSTTTFQGSARGVRAGYPMVLDGHPADDLNQKYLVTRARFFFHQTALPKRVQRKLPEMYRELAESAADASGDPQPYNVEFEAVAYNLPYRPARKTKAPTIRGFSRAIVDGASADSDYAQIDEHGRYRVRFLFDHDDSDCEHGQGSAYLRMMQPHAGDIEGFHFPLRRDTEVMVAFVDGNPDRPVIAGSVPTAITPSPVTDKNHTQNIIKTGGKNHITFEDKEGKEWIFAGSPNKNSYLKLGLHPDEGAHVRLHTDASSAFSFGGDWTVDVGGGHREKITTYMYQEVGSDVTQIYGGVHITNITGDRDVTVGGSETRTITGGYTRKSTTTKVTSSNTDLNLGMTNVKASMIGVDSGRIAVKTGALTGTMNAISLAVPGGVMFDTPTWTVTTPKWHGFTASSKSLAGKGLSMRGLNFGVYGVSTTVVGQAITLGVFKAETIALFKDDSPITLGTKAVKAIAIGIKSWVSGSTIIN